jgi:hypothetical protein
LGSLCSSILQTCPSHLNRKVLITVAICYNAHTKISTDRCTNMPTDRLHASHSIHKWSSPHNKYTERCDRVFPPTLYSGGPGFKSRPRGQLSWLTKWFSSVSPGQCRYSALKLGYNRFLPNLSHFIINLLPFNPTLYSLHYWKSIIKWTTNKQIKKYLIKNHKICWWYKCRNFY